MERQRGLVAMVAVCDQERRLRQRRRRLTFHAPELVAHAPQLHLEQRLACGAGEAALVEKEDRLYVRPNSPQQTEKALLRPGMSALVRKDDACVVRLESQGDDEALAGARDPIGAGVVLSEPPEGRLLVSQEHALGLPVPPEPRRLGLVVRESQVNDVVGATGEVAFPLLGRDHVVRWRHQVGEWPGPALVVADGAKGLDQGHERPAYQPPSGLDSAGL